MLASSNKNQGESLTVELFRESLVHLLVEVGSMRGQTTKHFDEAAFIRFKTYLDQTKAKSKNSFSECHSLFKIISKYKVDGKDIDQVDIDTLKSANKDELFKSLQSLYNNVKLFSETLGPQGNSLFLVG